MISEGESSQAMDVKPVLVQPRYTTDTYNAYNKKDQELDIINCAIICLIKIIQITLYYLISSIKLLDFFFIVFLVCVDFWMCKNIFGKKLAGLRWWTQINIKTQQQQWIFQSCDPEIRINKINNGIFWISNFTVTVFWAINALILLIVSDLFWITLSGFSLLMYSLNMLCYYKCRGNHQKKLISIMQRVGLKSAASMLTHQAQSDNNFQKFQIE